MLCLFLSKWLTGYADDAITITPRNLAQKAVRDPQGAFRPRVIRDKTKYTRKKKHKENY
jgi:hypothetical protein